MKNYLIETSTLRALYAGIVYAMLLILFPAGNLFGQEKVNFHHFLVEDIYGNDYPLSQLEGKKVMVVNTASRCGLTPQYDALEELYQNYKDLGFVVLGFPANNFMNQEPGTNDEILSFCQENYGVSFPMMSKISVRGDDIAPVYEWLTKGEHNGVKDAAVSWNFQKFLIDEEGWLYGVLSPRESPFSSTVTDWITGVN